MTTPPSELILCKYNSRSSSIVGGVVIAVAEAKIVVLAGGVVIAVVLVAVVVVVLGGVLNWPTQEEFFLPLPTSLTGQSMCSHSPPQTVRPHTVPESHICHIYYASSGR